MNTKQQQVAEEPLQWFSTPRGKRICIIGVVLLGATVVAVAVMVSVIRSNPSPTAPTPSAAGTLAPERCKGVDWQEACERILGDKRRLTATNPSKVTALEDNLVNDPSVTYDEDCLIVYRLDLFDSTTFPYHASQLLRDGGDQSIAFIIQHGATRKAEEYFCNFQNIMMEQNYRAYDDILVIAPNFNYKDDDGVLPTDAFWNTTKPWGDWRDGAESDPGCCGSTQGGPTVSSFEILDHMLGILTDKGLYPNIHKISFVGHSAGGQMVHRYAMMSQLAATHDADPTIDLQFVVANPSSYAYLDSRRWKYTCGYCDCDTEECICDQDCQDPLVISELGVPEQATVAWDWVCYDEDYNNWPYGMGNFSDGEYSVPYVLESGPERAALMYDQRSVVYLVGQNDTCNDLLPTCDASCWKRSDFSDGEGGCSRDDMDVRCSAMLEGPNRRSRGLQYMKYLENVYGHETHVLHVIPGVGHDATAMFASSIALQELFD